MVHPPPRRISLREQVAGGAGHIRSVAAARMTLIQLRMALG
jgi:hypothetical protein